MIASSQHRDRSLPWWLAAVMLLLTAAPLLAAPTVPAQDVETVARALSSAQNGGVFDLSHLLKPGGIGELQDLSQQVAAKGRRVWFVTVPPEDSSQTMAEEAYGRLG